MNDSKINHPGWAPVLSFIFNGLGQLYNGQIFKGLVIIFLSCVSMLVLIIGATLIGLWLIDRLIFQGQVIFGGILFLISLVAMCILAIYSILDAYRVALKKST